MAPCLRRQVNASMIAIMKRVLETMPRIARASIGLMGASQLVPLNTEPFGAKYGW